MITYGPLVTIFEETKQPNSSTELNRSYLNSLPKNDIIVYTDGSKTTDGRVGTGFVVFQMNRLVFSGARRLGTNNEVQDAEVSAVLHGIKAALALSTIRYANDMWIFLDNKEVTLTLKNAAIKSSQLVYNEITKANKIWKIRTRLPHLQEGSIRVCWIPGHSLIEGNELADLEARGGTSLLLQGNQSKYSLASLKSWDKSLVRKIREEWWKEQAPKSYSQLEIKDAPKIPEELLLSRNALGRIISLRTGHGDFAIYHNCFNHPDSKLHCHCGSLNV